MPLTPLEQHSLMGMQAHFAINSREISIDGGDPVKCIRSDVEIDPRELVKGGSLSRRRFVACIQRTDLAEVPHQGQEVIDDLGASFEVLLVSQDAIQVTITCDSYG